MTREEIAAKAVELQREIAGISIPLTTSGQLKLFKQIKRMFNDLTVLIRELAECK